MLVTFPTLALVGICLILVLRDEILRRRISELEALLKRSTAQTDRAIGVTREMIEEIGRKRPPATGSPKESQRGPLKAR